MANHASAEKRNRQRLVRTERNRGVRSTVRTAVKKARAAIAEGDKTAAAPLVSRASNLLAQAVSKGIVHRNTGARTTSRINSALAKLG
ncbi:MAG TPA: 30S ribosomal protein S20 [Polyangiaceae bacterium]|nr:30S ribosomal protein S20 [Polyangiaceae bacterium]HMR77444.1 30S ribosomal protein S20 [Polyangiaceae bacterium]